MMGETRQQEPREFAEEMASLENKTINEIRDICRRHNIGNAVPATAIFIAHVMSCVLEVESEKAEAEGEA